MGDLYLGIMTIRVCKAGDFLGKVLRAQRWDSGKHLKLPRFPYLSVILLACIRIVTVENPNPNPDK